MQFIKYPSLTNHYVADKQKYINFEDEYVATEKIHGSNVSVIVDNLNNIEIAKRTALLTKEERTQEPWNTLADFVIDKKDFILSWTSPIRTLAEKYGHIVQINFYGELYGSKVTKGKQMSYQETIDKTRRIRFFDIHVIFENGQRLALSQNKMNSILGHDYTVPVLRQGKLVDLILNAEELQSKLGHCVAEGQVYKPKNDYLFKPDDYGNSNFPVVRHKYDAWLEKQEIEVKHSMNHTANELKLTVAVESRVTLQRLLNVLSHGDIQLDTKNTGLVIKEMIQDIKDEIIKEEPDININSDKPFNKQGGKIAKLFKEYLTESK
jgi:hypothetical protein